MAARLEYGTTAKVFHWLIVALLVLQYLIGWFMPDIHRGMQPGAPMFLHISVGMLILVLIVLRLVWRLTHPVVPADGQPPWRRLAAEATHWLLYVLVLATTLTGWNFVAFRNWEVALFGLLPLPLIEIPGKEWLARGHWHQVFEYALLGLIGMHVAAALAHVFVFRDGVMRRMLRVRG
jgi:cytochrome b561